MSDIINGGITITLGTYELKQISQYSPSWNYEEKETFEGWDFSEVTVPKGRRFQLTVTANNLSPERKDALMKALFKRQFNIVCPDYTGIVRVTSVNLPIKTATRFGTWYTVSFSVAAVGLEGSGGSL